VTVASSTESRTTSPIAARSLRVRTLTWPLPPSWVLVPFVLVAVVTGAQMLQARTWSFVDLPALAALPMSTLLLGGPVASGAVALMTSMTWGPRSPLGSVSAVRAGLPTALRQSSVLIGALTLAFVLFSLPFVLRAEGQARAGEIYSVLYVYAVTLFVFFVALGYCIGALFPFRLVFLVAAAMAGVVGAVEAYVPATRPARALVPLVSGEIYVGDVASLWPWAAKSLLVLSAAVALLWLSAMAPSVRYRRSTLTVAGAPLLGVALLSVLFASSTPSLYRTDRALIGVCTPAITDPGPELCLAEAQLDARAPIQDAATRIFGVVGGAPDALSAISADVLDPARRTSAPTTDAAEPNSPATVWITVHPEVDLSATTTRALTTYLSGAYACAEGGAYEQVVRSGQIDMAITSQLQAPLPSDDLARWYSANQADILACNAPALPAALRTDP